MKYDCVACISIGNVPSWVPPTVSDGIDISIPRAFFSATDRNFKVNFESWLRVRYWNKKKILIFFLCLQVDERISIETRSGELIDKEGEVIEADVKVMLFEENDFSKISIGVFTKRLISMERLDWCFH